MYQCYMFYVHYQYNINITNVNIYIWIHPFQKLSGLVFRFLYRNDVNHVYANMIILTNKNTSS